jgi:hypothetical protein
VISKEILISLIARPLFLSVRALLSFFVIATVDNPYSILLLFAFVALFKGLVDRNKSIRFLGRSIDYTIEFWRYIYDLIPAIILIYIITGFWRLTWMDASLISIFTVSEIFFSFIALQNETRPRRLFLLSIIIVAAISLILFFIQEAYPSLFLIAGFNLMLSVIVLRKLIWNAGPRPALVIPDFYIMLQTIFAFSAKYIYIIFDEFKHDQLVEIFLLTDVYLFLFNVFYPVFRSFGLNRKGVHFIISFIISIYIYLTSGYLYAMIFFVSYLRLYYTAIVVNDKRNTSLFLYVYILEFVARLFIVYFLTNIDLIGFAIAGTMIVTIIFYVHAKDVSHNNALS